MPKIVPARVPTTPTPAPPGPRFHGHHPSSGPSSSEGLSDRRQKANAALGTVVVGSQRTRVFIELAEGETRMGRRNTVSNSASASAKEKRSRSLANPPSLTGSRARSAQQVDGVDTGAGAKGNNRFEDSDDAPSRARSAAR
ncbi:hypothetical protein D9619_002231 [Psilocybe cf. subviscida]|uniref:Uncharacterized protein n=1 Tax=Psilocybe cf. subviscida TaxID=2480587 RepID=A0A8H5BCV6_9AGAR|nr:hypothetical protein D9619_002231 [Psilocybe cf. subviscida]